MHVNTNKPYRNLHNIYRNYVSVDEFREDFGQFTNPNKHSTYTLYLLNNVLENMIAMYYHEEDDFRINRINIYHSLQVISFNNKEMVVEVADVFVQTGTVDVAYRIIPPHSISHKMSISNVVGGAYEHMGLSKEFEFIPMEINGETEFPVKKHQLDVILTMFDDIYSNEMNRDDFIFLCKCLFEMSAEMPDYKGVDIINLNDHDTLHKNPTHNKTPLFFLCETKMKSVMNPKTDERFLIIMHGRFETEYFSKVATEMVIKR